MGAGQLSPGGVAERRLYRLLTVGVDAALPSKLSSELIEYPKERYESGIQASLRIVSELLIEDIIRQDEVEQQFYEECYCESGALEQHALVSKKLLKDRYSALFSLSIGAPEDIKSVSPEKGELSVTPEVIAEAMANRPIVLLGDVGVGKTSFLKNLVHVVANEELDNAIYIYINFGSHAALTHNIIDFVLMDVEQQLMKNYGIDIYENKFVRGVYNLELKRFDKGIYGSLKDTNRDKYDEKVLEFLDEKISSRDRHIKECISHISKGRQKQVIISIDNADQRTYKFQQEAFLISQQIAQEWNAVVFIALRPQTFYASKKSGALSAYPQKVFTISPPRADLVVEKRLRFALNIAEGRIPFDKLQGVKFNLPNMVLLIRAILNSMNKNQQIIEFLSNITGGNIRDLIDLVSKFIGSPNVEADKIIRIMSEEGRYLIPVHEFWKEALLGHYSHYHPDSSKAVNLFDTIVPDTRFHFLMPMILSYLDFDGSHRNKEGFVAIEALLSEMQERGFTPSAVDFALRRLNSKRLIETPERITFEENEEVDLQSPSLAFRITTIGAYHFKRWMTDFAYFDAMLFDTPIMNPSTRKSIVRNIHTFDIVARLDRSEKFRDYLTKEWHASRLATPYFNWTQSVTSSSYSFEKVEKFIERRN